MIVKLQLLDKKNLVLNSKPNAHLMSSKAICQFAKKHMTSQIIGCIRIYYRRNTQLGSEVKLMTKLIRLYNLIRNRLIKKLHFFERKCIFKIYMLRL